MELSALHTRFQEAFESEPGRAFFAPGRINLIGEHTDYNGGRVFPCAITQGTYGIARRRQDSLVRCYSLNFEEAGLISFDLSQELVNRPEDSWTNFVKGEVKFLRQAGHTIDQGFGIIGGDYARISLRLDLNPSGFSQDWPTSREPLHWR